MGFLDRLLSRKPAQAETAAPEPAETPADETTIQLEQLEPKTDAERIRLELFKAAMECGAQVQVDEGLVGVIAFLTTTEEQEEALIKVFEKFGYLRGEHLRSEEDSLRPGVVDFIPAARGATVMRTILNEEHKLSSKGFNLTTLYRKYHT
jgi:hypothetical protein